MELITVLIGDPCNTFSQPVVNTLQILSVIVIINIIICEKS